MNSYKLSFVLLALVLITVGEGIMLAAHGNFAGFMSGMLVYIGVGFLIELASNELEANK